MNDIIKITWVDSKHETMTSIQIAEITGKQHSHVMRDIRNVLDQGVSESNFGLGSYTDANGMERPCYFLTKKGCLILASGYDVKLREKIIDRWEELESTHSKFEIPQSFSEALMLAAKQAEQIEAQQKQLKEQAPKILFSDAVATSTKSCLIRELAKLIKQNGVDTGENRLYAWLRNNGYLCKFGESYNQPTQKAMEMGLFEIKKTSITKPSGDILVTTTTKVTGKGQIYFVNKFLNNR